MSERLNGYDGPTSDMGADAIRDYINSGEYANESAEVETPAVEAYTQQSDRLEPAVHAVDLVDTGLHNLAHEARQLIDQYFAEPEAPQAAPQPAEEMTQDDYGLYA